MTANVTDFRHERSRLRYAGPALWTTLVAGVLVVGVLAYLTMPDQMTIHWRMGLDGAVSERTVSRPVGSFLFAPVAALTLALALGFTRVRNRSVELAVVYDLVVTAILLALAVMQALLVLLNLVVS